MAHFAAMSDLERLLLSPDAHMTPETAAKVSSRLQVRMLRSVSV